MHYYSSVQAVVDHEGNHIGPEVCIFNYIVVFFTKFTHRKSKSSPNSNYMNITLRNMAKRIQI